MMRTTTHRRNKDMDFRHDSAVKLAGALLFAVALQSIGPQPAMAQPATSDCAASLQSLEQKLAQAKSGLSLCLDVKGTENRTFAAKRARYLQLIEWNNRLVDHGQQSDLVNDIRERDFLLASKFRQFEHCLAEIPRPETLASVTAAGDTCENTLVKTREALDRVQASEQACNKCDIGYIDGGYDQSPVEILVRQDKDARALCTALYAKVMDDEMTAAFSSEDQWQALRDILLPHVQDVAHERRTSPRFIELLEKIQDPVQDQPRPDAVSDEMINILLELRDVLRSGHKSRLPHSEALLDKLAREEAESAPGSAPQTVHAYDNAQELVAEIMQFSRATKTALAEAIDSVITYYRKLQGSA